MSVVAELLSLREYGARRGVSHTAVRKAAVAGRLGPAARQDEAGRWLIEPELADREWARNTDPAQQRAAERKVTSRRGAPAAKRRAARSSKAKGRKAPTATAPPEPEVASVPDAAGDSIEDLEHRLRVADSYAEVRRISEEMRTRLLAIEHRVKTGALVEARLVRRGAHAVGQTIKEKLRSWPAAVAAELAAESDASVVLVRLEQAIDEALEELADAG